MSETCWAHKKWNEIASGIKLVFYFCLHLIFITRRYLKKEPCKFYIHGSVHRESNWIIFQQDANVLSLLHFCRQLYMFRVLTPIVKSSYNCNYSFCHWSTASTTIRCHCWVGTQQQERMVSTPETCRVVYRCVTNWIQSHLVGQLFNHVNICWIR